MARVSPAALMFFLPPALVIRSLLRQSPPLFSPALISLSPPPHCSLYLSVLALESSTCTPASGGRCRFGAAAEPGSRRGGKPDLSTLDISLSAPLFSEAVFVCVHAPSRSTSNFDAECSICIKGTVEMLRWMFTFICCLGRLIVECWFKG